MSAPLLTTGALVICPHGGQGTIVPSQTATMAGTTVCTQSDMVQIAGCPFTIGPNPSPCLTVKWLTASTVCTADGKPLLTTNSVGLCMSPANTPQGSVALVPGQTVALGAS